MTSNYQDVRDDARNSRDILAHRSRLASVPYGDHADTERYTIRPTLEYDIPGGEPQIILAFDGDHLLSFDDPQHAMNTLVTLSVVPFIDTDDATTALLDSDTSPYVFRGENRTDAVRAAALWSAEYGRPNDVPQFHILWEDDQDDRPAAGTLRAV